MLCHCWLECNFHFPQGIAVLVCIFFRRLALFSKFPGPSSSPRFMPASSSWPARGHTSRPPVIHAARPRERALIEAMRVCACVRVSFVHVHAHVRLHVHARVAQAPEQDQHGRGDACRVCATVCDDLDQCRLVEQRRARLRPLRFKRRGWGGRVQSTAGGARHGGGRPIRRGGVQHFGGVPKVP